MLSYTLPRTCRTCRGPVTYTGRGRPPATCSPECRRAARADDRAAQRAARVLGDNPRARYWATEAPGAATLDDIAPSLDDADDPTPLPYVGVRLTEGGTAWDDRDVIPRSQDAAAMWLAQHHPEELATFPPALR